MLVDWLRSRRFVATVLCGFVTLGLAIFALSMCLAPLCEAAEGSDADSPLKLLELVDDLRDRDWTKRLEAVKALGKLAKELDEAAVDALAATLWDANPLVARQAAEELGRIGQAASGASGELIQVAFWNSDSGVRRAALDAIGQVGAPKDEALKVAAVARYDSDSWVAVAAMRLLRKIGADDLDVASSLLATATDAGLTSEWRTAAVQALMRSSIGESGGGGIGTLTQDIERVLEGYNGNSIWARPSLVPVPERVGGVDDPYISLDGTWLFSTEPSGIYWSDDAEHSPWAAIEVPGEAYMQGFDVHPDIEYAYKREVQIPERFAGRRIILQFDGVYSYARLWVNGRFVRDHNGGFTSWQADITEFVEPGEKAVITVGVTDRSNDISRGSGYANHTILGIIRKVGMFAVPVDCLTRFHVETDLDSSYSDGTLRVMLEMDLRSGEAAEINLSLRDAGQKLVQLNPGRVTLTADAPSAILEIPVSSPLKWDAEHPNLYTIEAEVRQAGEVTQTLSRRIGFREVEVRGNKLFVNGQEVKLRGVNRHSVDPVKGRTVSDELAELDAVLFKAANVNFIRTSHYPPSQAFLDACDEYGIYVEEEVAVAFTIKGTENSPEMKPAYMNQLAEMVERDRSHASVIIWSIANESSWGDNFQAMYDYVKQEDRTRPVIFSYPEKPGHIAPENWPDVHPQYDIFSFHYASYNDRMLGREDVPVLHDEYAHVICLNTDVGRTDLRVRDAWGESIKRFWDNIFETDGALGGAIWAAIDEVYLTPSGPVGNSEWGIIDAWRRPKPEYWLTKKAYSPVKIDDAPLKVPANGEQLRVPVQNRFDHTNLNEVTIRWSVGEASGEMRGPNVEPHSRGTIVIPASAVQGDVLHLSFYSPGVLTTPLALGSPEGSYLVDEYKLPIGTDLRTATLGSAVAASGDADAASGSAGTPTSGQADVASRSASVTGGPAGATGGLAPRVPDLKSDDSTIRVVGGNFEIAFSRETGLITGAIYEGVRVIESGPYLNVEDVRLDSWSLKSIDARTVGQEVIVSISGRCGELELRYELRIDGAGRIRTIYTIDKMPFSFYTRSFHAVGIIYKLTDSTDALTWNRKGLWSVYPSDHIGRTSGTAYRFNAAEVAEYGAKPEWPWSMDMTNFYIFGKDDPGDRPTRDFRSLKENIYDAWAGSLESGYGLAVESDGSHAVRMEAQKELLIDDRDTAVRYSGSWSQGGNLLDFHHTCMTSPETGSWFELEFDGSVVEWIGPMGRWMGKAAVYIDGDHVATVDLYNTTNTYQRMLYRSPKLADGKHTIRVVVTGERNPASTGTSVAVDLLRVPVDDGTVDMVIDTAWGYRADVSWGNYEKRAVNISPGYKGEVTVRLSRGSF